VLPDLVPICEELGYPPVVVNGMEEFKRAEGNFDLFILHLGPMTRNRFPNRLFEDTIHGKFPNLSVAKGLLLNVDDPIIGLQDAYVRLCSNYCQLHLVGDRITPGTCDVLRETIAETIGMPPLQHVNYYKDGPITYDVLHSVVESSQAPIMVLSPDDRVLFANMVTHALFQRPPYLMSQTPIQEFLAPGEALARFQVLMSKARTTRSGTAELRLVDSHGKEFDALVFANRIFRVGMHENTVAMSFYDITERKRAEDALRQAHWELAQKNADLETRNDELEKALNEIKTLRGLIPICMYCKRVRDDGGFWHNVEMYVRQRTEAEFSHGLCPECAKKHYPGMTEGTQQQ
jgi:PAS domain S-box-containing protein